jgi:CheY-like chemotaxis protein
METLVAADNRIIRRMLEVILTQWRYEVVSAADGNRAWELLQANDAPTRSAWSIPNFAAIFNNAPKSRIRKRYL